MTEIKELRQKIDQLESLVMSLMASSGEEESAGAAGAPSAADTDYQTPAEFDHEVVWDAQSSKWAVRYSTNTFTYGGATCEPENLSGGLVPVAAGASVAIYGHAEISLADDGSVSEVSSLTYDTDPTGVTEDRPDDDDSSSSDDTLHYDFLVATIEENVVYQNLTGALHVGGANGGVKSIMGDVDVVDNSYPRLKGNVRITGNRGWGTNSRHPLTYNSCGITFSPVKGEGSVPESAVDRLIVDLKYRDTALYHDACCDDWGVHTVTYPNAQGTQSCFHVLGCCDVDLTHLGSSSGGDDSGSSSQSTSWTEGDDGVQVDDVSINNVIQDDDEDGENDAQVIQIKNFDNDESNGSQGLCERISVVKDGEGYKLSASGSEVWILARVNGALKYIPLGGSSEPDADEQDSSSASEECIDHPGDKDGVVGGAGGGGAGGGGAGAGESGGGGDGTADASTGVVTSGTGGGSGSGGTGGDVRGYYTEDGEFVEAVPSDAEEILSGDSDGSGGGVAKKGDGSHGSSACGTDCN